MAYTWRRTARACVVLLAIAALVAAIGEAPSATAAHLRSAGADKRHPPRHDKRRAHKRKHKRHTHKRKRHTPAKQQSAPPAPSPPPLGLSTGSYSSGAGTRSYELYVPPSNNPGAPMPLVVALHGCTQTADQFRQLTRFDALAAAKGFIVVFPQQDNQANTFGCWNWFVPNQMQRGDSEPSMIAGITNQVRQRYAVDGRHIYVAGFSAGGAMAEVMGATYPDLYAAIGVGDGCEYDAGAPCAFYRSADPEQAGRAAYQAMGSYARAVPFVAFEGDQDNVVAPVNAQQLVRAGQVAADWADDGSENGSVPQYPTSTNWSLGANGGQMYTTSSYSDGRGHELAQLWTVRGMSHAWSGGNAAQQYSDPSGPDETLNMYLFFMNHPMP